MMRQSLPPAMNMDSVLEGRLKCRVARKGERRSAGSEDADDDVVVDKDVEWESTDGEATVSKDTGLVSSGCLMTTHS